MRTRSTARQLFGLALACLLALPLARAADYPEKPITLIIPLGAGGSHDLNARVFTSVIPTYLGQPMVVKLMPGAGGQIGTAAAAKAAPDGYTLIFTHNYIDQLQQHVEKLPYDPTKALEAIAQINYAPAAIVVRADSRFKTLQEMFEWGRKNPGKLKFGHSGNWGAFMVPGAQLLGEAGVEATFIAHKGGGPVMQALLAGDIDFTGAFPSVISAQGDKIRVLATAGDKSPYPGVPTFKELGFTSNIGQMTRVVLAPRGVPEERKMVLWDALVKLNKDKTYLSLMKQLGENTELMSGPDYEKLRAQQKEAYKKLVEQLTK
ncbi:MAG: tripartite tricarboxylate transporter substrate binding protein [Burkholderiales bacterium]|nr:tripartite tricarboxylate transporter substrate binding protein [Burkholderiales bacterium]